MLMTQGVPQPSAWCARGDHDACPHWVGMAVAGSWRLRPRPEVILCNDPCHGGHGCPLTGQRKTARDEWDVRCTCPGAAASRRAFERSEGRRREMAAILADVDLSDHPDAGTVELRLRNAFLAHGTQPPNLTGMSRVMAAGTGPRGTRSPRLLWLGVRATARAVRWAVQPGTDADADDRRSLRRMYAADGGLIALGVLLTAAAIRASGWRRLPWAATALLTWLFTTRIVAIGALVTSVVRVRRDEGSRRGSRRRG